MTKPRPRRDFAERFFEKVSATRDGNGCTRWIGYIHRQTGYGAMSIPLAVNRWRMEYAHRIAYRLANGEIPTKVQIHHICEHPWCVNPDHLALATLDAHNTIHKKRWAINKARTHCLHGHPFNESNTGWGKDGSRRCRACARRRAAERRHRRK